jgi:hypothetical protein
VRSFDFAQEDIYIPAMPLRLRIWAWALIVGFFIWIFSGLLIPVILSKTETYFGKHFGMVLGSIIVVEPLLLLMVALMLMRLCRNVRREQPFTVAEIIFYRAAVVIGSLPTVMVICFIVFVILSPDR